MREPHKHPESSPNTPQLGSSCFIQPPRTKWLVPHGDARADRPMPSAGSCQASSQVTTGKGREDEQPNFPLASEREGGEKGAVGSQG